MPTHSALVTRRSMLNAYTPGTLCRNGTTGSSAAHRPPILTPCPDRLLSGFTALINIRARAGRETYQHRKVPPLPITPSKMVAFHPSVPGQRQPPDGASRTPVHRLSTETLRACLTRPCRMSKSPAQMLRRSTRSRKPNPRPTHYDAQTPKVQFRSISRSSETINPRSKA